MIFEIAGIDGSGKSSLIRGLKEELDRRRGIWAYERSFRLRSRRLFEAVLMAEGHSRAESAIPKEVLAFTDAVDLLDEAQRTFFGGDGRQFQAYFLDHYYLEALAKVRIDSPHYLDVLSRIYNLMPRPALAIVLDVDPEVALKRVMDRPGGDQILQLDFPLDFLRRRRNAYLEASDVAPYRTVVVDASVPACSVLSQALMLIDTALRDLNGPA